MKRNDLSLRRVTNVTTLDDDTVIQRTVSFLAYLQQQRPEMEPSRTILMDETTVYFHDPHMLTVEETGAQHVVMHLTGFQSIRITAVLAVTASGHKLTPLLIWKGNSEAVATINGCWVAQHPCAWVNQGLFTKWMDRASPLPWMNASKHIVWGSMRAHTSKVVKAYCAKRGIGMTVIPGGMTSYLQVGDIGIYKSFKDHINGIIDEWKRSDKVQYTRGGNPNVEVVTAWVRQAWRADQDEVVAKSIKKAFFSERVDDWQIATHDVYGEQCYRAWGATAQPSFSREELKLCEAIDDVSLIDA